MSEPRITGSFNVLVKPRLLVFQSRTEVSCSVSSDQSNLESKPLNPGIEASAEKLQVNDDGVVLKEQYTICVNRLVL